MEMIIKFGEHYYNESTSIWIQFVITVFGAFLGFGSALFFYFKSYRRRQLESEINAQIKHKNRLEYHNLLIENLLKNVRNQINSLEQYKTDQEIDLLNAIPTMQVSTSDIKRLLYINKDVFESLSYFYKDDQNWIEDLKQLHIWTDFIQGNFKEITRITNSHLRVCYDISSEVKQKIELIPDRFSILALKLQNQLGEKRWQDSLYVFVNDFITKYIELVEKEANLHQYSSELLNPFIERYLADFKNEPQFDDVILLAKSSLVKMNDIMDLVKENIKQMNQIKSNLIDSINEVEESIQKLNKVIHK